MIRPGPIGVAAAAGLREFLRLVRENRRRAEALVDGGVDRFPAVVTDYDPVSGRYSWSEQTWDQYGSRVLKSGGRSGSFSYSPAYSFGDGSVVTEFPHPTTLYRRVVATEIGSGSGGLGSGGGSLGPVYEFPLACGCVMGSGSGPSVGSGSGTQPGFVLAACCPNPVARTLTVTMTAPTIPCLDGQSFQVFYVEGSLLVWQSAPAVTFGGCGSDSYFFALECPFSGFWRLYVRNLSLSGCVFSPDPASPTALYALSPPASTVCDPLALAFTTNFGGASCGAGGVPGAVTFIVTE